MEKKRIFTRSRMKFLAYTLIITVLLTGILTASSTTIGSKTLGTSGKIEYHSASWTFVQLTDLHYGADSTTNTLCQHSVQFINEKALSTNIDFVLVTGDIIHNEDGQTQSGQNFQDVESLLDQLTMEYYTVMGNHDNNGVDTDPSMYLQYLGDHQGGATSTTHYDFDHEDLRFVVVGQNDRPHTVSSEELTFLDNSLSTGRLSVIVFHEVLDYADPQHEVANPQEVIDTISPHENAKLFICGHAHPSQSIFTDLGTFHQYVMAPTGRRWGVGYGYVTLFEVTQNSISISVWRTSDDNFQYAPSQVQTFTVSLGSELPPPPPPPSGFPQPFTIAEANYIVPDDGSLQSVIDNAASGSKIWVRAGTYQPFNFHGKTSIEVQGEPAASAPSPSKYPYGPPFFPDPLTVIQGPRGSSQKGLVDFQWSSNCAIRFLTLRDGNEISGDWGGTGVHMTDSTSNPSIEYVNIYDCENSGVSLITWDYQPHDTNYKVWGCKIDNCATVGVHRGANLQTSRGTGTIAYSISMNSRVNGFAGPSDYGSSGSHPAWGWQHHNVAYHNDGVGFEGGSRDNVVEYCVSWDNGLPYESWGHTEFWFENYGGSSSNPSGNHNLFRYNTAIWAGENGFAFNSYAGSGTGTAHNNVVGQAGWYYGPGEKSAFSGLNRLGDEWDNYYVDSSSSDVHSVMQDILSAYSWATYWEPNASVDFFHPNYVWSAYVSLS